MPKIHWHCAFALASAPSPGWSFRELSLSQYSALDCAVFALGPPGHELQPRVKGWRSRYICPSLHLEASIARLRDVRLPAAAASAELLEQARAVGDGQQTGQTTWLHQWARNSQMSPNLWLL